MDIGEIDSPEKAIKFFKNDVISLKDTAKIRLPNLESKNLQSFMKKSPFLLSGKITMISRPSCVL